jgi:putative oxygen-independent coproporphyrinogen III oxidase
LTVSAISAAFLRSSHSLSVGFSDVPHLSTPPLSLYVHFPWCVRKCPYCDFNSYTLHGELDEHRYVEALERDIEAQAVEVRGREVISIFFGGGTPSLFSPEAIGRVFAAARRHLTLASDVEVTMEANPGAIERGKFAEYRAAGLTRVSLGAQSFDPQRLQRLGRIHSPDETRRAATELHAVGLDNFNLDLMYALPEQDAGAAVRDIEEALALEPAHLSHYQLTIEPGTVFAARPPDLPDDDTAAEMLAECSLRMAGAGFAQYEVSAYARAGRQCRHNLNYWTFGDYLGVGAGAHGKLTLPALESITRTLQLREPRRYLASIPAAVTQTRVDPHELPFEFMLNALRLVCGFDTALFSTRTGLDWETVAGPIEALVGRGLIVREGACHRPSPQGLRFLNELLLSFVNEVCPERAKMAGAFGLSTTS